MEKMLGGYMSLKKRFDSIAGKARVFSLIIRQPINYFSEKRMIRELKRFDELSPREKKWYEKHYAVEQRKRLSKKNAEKARQELEKAFAIDIACGKPAQLIFYAKMHPERFFVGIDSGEMNREWENKLKATPNAFLIRADALQALELVKTNSKRIINIGNFPYFDKGRELAGNIAYRKKLFAEVFRTLKPNGTLLLTTHFPELAKTELEEAGFKARKPISWGKGRLKLEYASEYTKFFSAGLHGAPLLIIAKKQ